MYVVCVCIAQPLGGSFQAHEAESYRVYPYSLSFDAEEVRISLRWPSKQYRYRLYAYLKDYSFMFFRSISRFLAVLLALRAHRVPCHIMGFRFACSEVIVEDREATSLRKAVQFRREKLLILTRYLTAVLDNWTVATFLDFNVSIPVRT
jgi:hypothetical protein